LGVASTLDTLRTRDHLHFHINTGDNFYFSGITDEFDSRFEVK
jgi:hypothetical protein